MQLFRRVFFGLLLAGFPGAVTARAELPERFTLGRYVPDDVWLYVHAAETSETRWIREQWMRVWEALSVSDIGPDLAKILVSLAAPPDRVDAQAQLDSFRDMFSSINWQDIFFGKEFVFAERGAEGKMGYDYFLLSRSSAESADANFQALSTLIRRAGGASPRVRTASQNVMGTPTQVLFVSGGDMGMGGLRLTVFRRDDVLVLVTGKQSVRDVLRRMNEEESARSIVDLPRFQEALRHVPATEHEVTYIDIHMLLRDIQGQMSSDKLYRPGMLPPAIHQIRRVLEQFDVIDYFVSTATIEDQRQTKHMYSALRPGQENATLARVLADRQPFDPFDRYIPAKANSFSLNGLINVERLYHGVVSYLREQVKGGPAMLAKWESLLTQFGFDPQRDLFDWWSGELITVSLPAAMVTPLSREDFVWMVRVKDSDLAARKVNALLDMVTALFKDQGQPLALRSAQTRVEGFRQINHPMLTLLIQPVIGVHDGWLMIGSSSGAINQCLAVAAGEAPSIRDNERFKREGIAPDGPVQSAFFTDTTRFGEELAESLGAVGMVSGLLPMINVTPADGIHAEGAELIGLIQKLVPLMGRLGPVLREIDFYSSESGVSTFDGTAWREQRVIVYKNQTTLDESRLARKRTSGPE